MRICLEKQANKQAQTVMNRTAERMLNDLYLRDLILMFAVTLVAAVFTPCFPLQRRTRCLCSKKKCSRMAEIRRAYPSIACGSLLLMVRVLIPRCVLLDQEWQQHFSFSWHLMAWPLGSISSQQWPSTWLMSVEATTRLVSWELFL